MMDKPSSESDALAENLEQMDAEKLKPAASIVLQDDVKKKQPKTLDKTDLDAPRAVSPAEQHKHAYAADINAGARPPVIYPEWAAKSEREVAAMRKVEAHTAFESQIPKPCPYPNPNSP